jgi:hypothetical protein
MKGVVDVMKKRRWADLSPGQRRALVIAATIDGVIKLAALIDIWRRPADQIRGSKKVWAATVTLANTAGILPTSYFLFGRRRVA